MNPYNLDWGNITPEGIDNKRNEAIHVFNHELTSNENIERNIIFIIARVNWFKIHIPEGITQKIYIDVRGQNIDFNKLVLIKKKIVSKLKDVNIEFLKK